VGQSSIGERVLRTYDRSWLAKDLVAGLIRNQKPLADWPPMLFDVATNVRRGDVLLAEPYVAGTAIRRVLDTGADAFLDEQSVALRKQAVLTICRSRATAPVAMSPLVPGRSRMTAPVAMARERIPAADMIFACMSRRNA